MNKKDGASILFFFGMVLFGIIALIVMGFSAGRIDALREHIADLNAKLEPYEKCSFQTYTCYESVQLRQQAESYQRIAKEVFGK
jgi:hypothetical protein